MWQTIADCSASGRRMGTQLKMQIILHGGESSDCFCFFFFFYVLR